MGIIKKNAWVIFSLGISALYFFTRLYNILALPIFTDEAIYIRWSQIAAHDASWRFISLTDGKQPMFVWITMVLIKLIHDPLLAGRVTSVIAGLFSMIGLFFLGSETFKNKKIGILASFIYVLYPFSLVYDRMAMYDSLVAMFIIWSLYFEILLIRHMRLDLAMILGMIIGGGMLTKTNANFAFILLPFLLIFIDYKSKNWKKQVGKLFVFSLVALIIANIMYAVLRLSPFFHIIAEKNYVFIYPLSEWLMHPFTFFPHNLAVLIGWLVTYATIPFLLLAVSAFFVGYTKQHEKGYFREKLLLLIWFIVPFIASALFFKQFYPRFILFMTMPLLILGAYGLYYALLYVKQIWLKALVLIVFLIMFVINDFLIITNFAKAMIPQSDLGQFVTGWPAGQGVKETITFLEEKAQTQKIYVGTEGTFGLMPYALEMYLVDNPNVTIKGFWPMSDTPPTEAVAASKVMPTYFVFYQDCTVCPKKGLAPANWKVTPVLQIQKLEKGSYYTLYQLNTQ